jgi:hypothetical protein
MPRAPRPPKGPPLDSGWLKDAAAARKYLTEDRTPKRTPEEVGELVTAGRQGVALAEIIELFYPYRGWIRAKRGALSQRAPELSEAVILEDRWSEITHTDMLASGANPNGRRFSEINDELKKQDPLAPLGAIAEEALRFVETYSTLRIHAERLRRLLGTDPMFEQKLDNMRGERQMFAAAIIVYAERKNYPAPTAHDLAALALQLPIPAPEFAREATDDPDTVLKRVRAWENVKSEAKKGLVPFVKKLLATPLEPLNAAQKDDADQTAG